MPSLLAAFKKPIGPIYRLAIKHSPDYVAVNLAFLRTFHGLPNLFSPKSFNEKIAWRKLYQRDPRFTAFIDKVACKAMISGLVGNEHVIETLWTGDDPGLIPFESLPLPYVLKVNHASGGNIFVRKREDLDRDRIVDSLRRLLLEPHFPKSREWAYLNVRRTILAERMIGDPNGVPIDYKFFVYHGRVHFIQVDQDRFTAHKRDFFDRDWNPLPLTYIYPKDQIVPSAPQTLAQMVGIAEKIGSIFDFVRVDLYSVPAGVFFGEATFYPGGGREQFAPAEWDLKFGEPWKIPSP